MIKRPRAWRAVRLRTKRLVQLSWRNFRSAVNVSWLALRDPAIGPIPKALGALAALLGAIPLEWVPRIHPITVLAANFALIPFLIWLAWRTVSDAHKERLAQKARTMPLPWGFFAAIAAIFLTATGIDLAMDLAYPGRDAFSPVIDGWVEEWVA